MQNKKLYIITSIISVLLMIPSCFCPGNIATIFSNIGCSGITASIMAIYIERNAEKREQKRIEKARHIYFKALNEQLNMLFERILWFDERMDDPDFNWKLNPKEYSTVNYMVWADTTYKKDKEMTISEATLLLREIGEKYNLENQKNMPQEKLLCVHKMFMILAYSCGYLLNEAKVIKENKLLLETEGYISLDDVKSLLFDISLGVGLMNNAGKNYSVAIDLLISASEIVRRVGNYEGGIRTGLHGSVQISNL